MLIEPGTYDGTVTEATIYEAPSGAVMCSMRVDVGGASTLKGGICLVQKDGTLSERGFKDAAAIFGLSEWDWNFWNQEPTEINGQAVSVVVETVQGERGEFSSIKYVNVPGGGAPTLERANVDTLKAKYGAKVRALTGGTSAPPPPKKPAPPPPPASVPGITKTHEECWEEFVKAHEGEEPGELYVAWDEYIAATVGKDRADCTPEDWGTIFLTFDVLPM